MDYLAGLLELCGSWLVGSRNRFGFVCNGIGCALWVAVAVRSGIYGLLLVAVPGVCVNARNLWKWRHNAEANQ